MTEDHLRRALAALEALDAEGLLALYADEFRFEDSAGGQVITDRRELRAYFDGLFGLPGTAFGNAEVFSCGDRGAARWTWSGINPRTRRPFAIQGASLFELGPGGITRETIFYDPTSAVGEGE